MRGLRKTFFQWFGVVGGIASILGFFVGIYSLLVFGLQIELTPLSFFWKCLWIVVFTVGIPVIPMVCMGLMSLGFDLADKLPFLSLAIKAVVLLMGVTVIAMGIGFCALAIQLVIQGHFPYCGAGGLWPAALALILNVAAACGIGLTGGVVVDLGRS